MKSFHLILGPMYSGKTSMLLEYFYANEGDVIAFKPAVDDRYSENMICTHSGTQIHASVINSIKEIDISKLKQRVVLFDEIQFFNSELVEFIETLLKANKQVIGCGLNYDYEKKPFSVVEKLKNKATKQTNLMASCHVCGEDARFTYLKSPELTKGQILVGGVDLYEARCHECYESK